MCYLTLDENGYLVGYAQVDDEEPIAGLPAVASMDGVDMSDACHFRSYRWDGEKLTLDEDRLEVRKEAEAVAQRVAELKAFLAATDYVAAKIAEGSATRKEYADVIAQRQKWRAEINELDGSNAGAAGGPEGGS